MSVDLCEGLYCGRSVGGEAECGSCAWGWRRNLTHWCTECSSPPLLYDWLYLGFILLLSVTFQGLILDVLHRRYRLPPQTLVILHVSMVCEAAVAGVTSLLSYQPTGSLSLHSCGVLDIRDWYSLFFNPKHEFVDTVHCAQEVVYPLYTLPMVFLAYSALAVVVVRAPLLLVCRANRISAPLCATLYLFPILLSLQAVFGGILYYAYPYILLVLALISQVWHLASQTVDTDITILELLVKNVTVMRNVAVGVGHWLLLAYAVISLTQIKDLKRDLVLLCLVPTPTFFYILTSKFTVPPS